MEIATAYEEHDDVADTENKPIVKSGNFSDTSSISPDVGHLTPTKSTPPERIKEHGSPDMSYASGISSDHSEITKANAAHAGDSEHIIKSNSDASSVSSSQSTSRKERKKNSKDPKEYWCSFCGKHFRHKGNMQQHERSHTKERPFSCNLCGMAYTKSSHLLEHRRKHFHKDKARDGNQRVHSCTHCSRSFSNKNSLEIHLRSHSVELSFGCEKCHMKFRYKSSLYRHLKVHAGIKNYACDYCQKTFYDGSDLRKHIAVHTGFKKYECTTCKKRFKLSSKLKSHLKSHITYETSNNNEDDMYDRNVRSGTSNTDRHEEGLRYESVEKSLDKLKESKEDNVINYTQTEKSSMNRMEADELIRHSGERKNMQVESGNKDYFENSSADIADKTVLDLTEKSFSRVAVDTGMSMNNNQHTCTSLVENAKDSFDNEMNEVITAEVENTSEKDIEHGEQHVPDNIESPSNTEDRNVSGYRKKIVVVNKRLKNVIDEYVKEKTTKNRAETKTIKEEVEDTDCTKCNELASDRITAHKTSTDTDIYVKKEVVDNSYVIAPETTVETNVTVKKEIEATFNIQKEITEIGEASSCSSSGRGIKAEKEQLQVESHVANDTESIEAFYDQSKKTGAARPEVHGEVQLDSSLVLTAVFDMPGGSGGADKHDCDKDSKPEDETPKGVVIPLRKEDMEISQTEYEKLSEAYLKTCRSGKTTTQKMFKIGTKTLEKESGKVRSISKFCVMRPKIQNSPVYCYENGVSKNSDAISVDTPLSREARTKTTGTCFVLRHEYSEKEKSQITISVQKKASALSGFSTKYCYIKPKPMGVAETEAMNCQQRDIRKKLSKILSRKTKVSGKSGLEVSKSSGDSQDTNISKNVNKALNKLAGDPQNVTNSEKVCETQHDLKGTSEEKVSDNIDISENKGIEIVSKDIRQQDGYVVLDTGIQINVPPVRTCRHCGKLFDIKEEFLQHLREHFRPKEFTCDDCNQSFGKWRDYSHHKCSDLKKLKSKYNFVCAHCDRLFINEISLKNHMISKKKTCPDCNKVFCSAEGLSRHKKTHLKYQCKNCSKKFQTKWSLTMHISSVHTTLKCRHCNKTFMYTNNLNRHIKQQHVNVWFNCENCGLKFVSTESYKKHKKTCQRIDVREKKEIDKVGDLHTEDIDSVENEGHQSYTEKRAKDLLKSDEEISENNMTDNGDHILFPQVDEIKASVASITEKDKLKVNEEKTNKVAEHDANIGLVIDDIETAVASISSITETDQLEEISNKKDAENDDHIRLSEKDEIMAAVASISSATEDQLTAITEENCSFQKEDESPKKNQDKATVVKLKNLSNLKGQENLEIENETNIESNEENVNIFGHEGNIVETEALPDTENEELDATDSSRTVEGIHQNETLRNTNKLIISNTLFRKREKAGKSTFKKIERHFFVKKPLASELKESNNLKTGSSSELTAKPNEMDSLKNMLGSMKNNMQAIARKMRATRVSAAAETLHNVDEESVKSNVKNLDEGSDVGESLVTKLYVEHRDVEKKSEMTRNETDDEKKSDMTRNEFTDSAEVIILDSSSDSDDDTLLQNTLPKNDISSVNSIGELDRKSNFSDSENETLEDDDRAYEEELLLGQDLKKVASELTGVGNSNKVKLESKVLDEVEIDKDKKVLGKRQCRKQSPVKGNCKSDNSKSCASDFGHYNTRKRKSEINNSLKSTRMLKEVEIVVCDIFKTGHKKAKMLAKGLNTDKKCEVLDRDIAIRDKEVITSDSEDDVSSDSESESESDEDNEGYEECTMEEVQAMLSSCKKH